MFLILFFCSSVYAQNGNGSENGQPNNQWKINGNNVDSNHFIGTTNLQDVKFRTNNVEHLRLTKEGDLGLGTSTPEAKLDVYGNVILRNSLQLPSTTLISAYANKYFLVIDSLGNVNKVPIPAPLGLELIPISKECDYLNPNGSIGIPNPSWSSGINKLYPECPSVFVGIATSTPRVNLDVRGSAYVNKLSLGVADPLSNGAHIHLKADLNPTSVANMVLVESGQQELLSLNYQGLLTTKNIILNSLDNSYGIKVNTQNDNTKAIAINKLETGEDAFVVYGNGQLWSTGVHVRSIGNFPDYVFQSNYNLMPLSELKRFINSEKHLPNMPSAFEVEKEGADLVELNRLLVEKIEELTLYILEQNEKIESLFQEQDKVIQMQKEMAALKQLLLNPKN